MLRNSILHILSSVGTAILNLIILVLSARVLGSEGRGEITYLLFYCTFIQIFTAIIGHSVMIYMLTKLEENSVLIISFIWTILIVTLASPVVLYFDEFIQDRILLFLCLTIFQSLYTNLLAFLSSKIQIKRLVLIKISQPLILILLIILSKKLDSGLFLGFLAISYIPSFLILLWRTFYKNFKFNILNLKLSFLYFIKLGALNQLNNLLQFGCYRYAIWIIADKLNLENVGVFGLWVTLIDALWLIPISIATMNQTYAAKNEGSVVNMKLCYISAGIVVILTGMALLIPLNIYESLLGKDFNELKKLLLISSPAIILFTFNIIIAYYFSAKGKIIYNTISSGLGFCVVISLSNVLINNYGLEGAVIANSVSYFVTTVATFFLYRLYKNHGKIANNES